MVCSSLTESFLYHSSDVQVKKGAKPPTHVSRNGQEAGRMGPSESARRASNARTAHGVCMVLCGGWSSTQIVRQHLPRHENSDETAERTDQECPHEIAAKVFAHPPAQVAASR